MHEKKSIFLILRVFGYPCFCQNMTDSTTLYYEFPLIPLKSPPDLRCQPNIFKCTTVSYLVHLFSHSRELTSHMKTRLCGRLFCRLFSRGAESWAQPGGNKGHFGTDEKCSTYWFMFCSSWPLLKTYWEISMTKWNKWSFILSVSYYHSTTRGISLV